VDEAETHLVEVLRLDPKNATAHANLGALLASRGRAAEAIAHLLGCADSGGARLSERTGRKFAELVQGRARARRPR